MTPSWLLDLLPGRMAVDARERARCVAGAGLGVLLTAWLCHVLAPAHAALPAAWLVAPIGASAVLVFALPGSPLAQPWSVVGGNTVSALVGIACVAQFGSSDGVAGAAVALAVAAMFALRCLHPPGGAVALLTVLGQVDAPAFALQPVLLNSVLLVAAGIAYNRLTGRRYPHSQQPLPAAASPAGATGAADVQAALRRYNQVLDVSPDDLQALLAQAELQAYRRRMGELRCADVMSREPLRVEYGTPLQEAWRLLRERHIKALPVVDTRRRVIGILTLADFMADAKLDLHDGWAAALRHLLTPTRRTHSDKPEAVGQIMSREVSTARVDQPLADLVPLFASTGHHHIPVVDDERRLVGILTQSDLVAALVHHEAGG